MKFYRVAKVFVPGGLPKHTYFPRASLNLEGQLRAVKDNLCKVVTVTGPTKSGKTVLVRHIFVDDRPIYIDGGNISSLDDFWEIAADHLSVAVSREEASIDESSGDIGGELAAEANLFVVKGKGKFSSRLGQRRGSIRKTQVATSLKAQVFRVLRESPIPIIIDDFHYIDRDL